jgi:hypothetical protein
MQFFRKNDGFRKILHWPPHPSAFAAQVQIRFFLGESITLLKNALRTLNDLSRFKRPLHFQRL